MNYYIATTYSELTHQGGGGSFVYVNRMLTEAETAADLAALKKVYDRIDPVSARAAHKWVREGNDHTTPLYVADNGKIRRAKENANV